MAEVADIWQKPSDEVLDRDSDLQAIELEKCEASFLYFLSSYVKVLVPPKPGEVGVQAIRPFEVRPHMAKAVKALGERKLVVWMKSRQIWASSLMSAYDYWMARFHTGANVMVMSKGKDEAAEKIHKCKVVHNNLPDWMRLPIDPDSTTVIGFPIKESKIMAFPATETAGIGNTASLIDCDEWAEHPYAEANYLALKPCRDAGGQFVGTFTPSLQGNSLAEEIFKAAINWPHHKTRVVNEVLLFDTSLSRNGYYPLFDGCFVVPGRTQEWYDAEKRNVPVMAFLTPDIFMRKAYPRTIEEALAPLETLTAFDHKVLDSMLGDVKQSIAHEGLDPKLVKIYKDYYVGGQYIAASDTSHGVGKDYAVTVVLNVKTGEVVADITSNVLSPQEFAYQTVQLLEVYRKPLWYIEANDWGGVTILSAQQLNYKHLGYQDAEKNKAGFLTGEKNRAQLWGELIAGINGRQITIYNENGINQFRDVIRVPEKQGRIEAKTGSNDDYPMALGIAWLKRGEADPERYVIQSTPTLTFSGARSYR
jgi:hypothetical protein